MPLSFAHWKNAASGGFKVAANWLDGVVPTATTQVYLDPSGPAYTVTSSSSTAIDYLKVGSNATLDVTTGTFTVYSTINPYSDADNYGTIKIEAASAVMFGKSAKPGNSQVRNVGTIQITTAGSKASLIFAAPFSQVIGGGDIVMSGANATISGGTTATTFDNDDNTISGSGHIGSPMLTLINEANGVIDADASALLVIDTGANFIGNTGIIETTGSGGLTIRSGMYDNKSLIAGGSGALTILNAEIDGRGSIAATATGASIQLSGATIDFGGTLSSVAGSKIVSVTATTNTISSYVENAGTLSVENGSTLLLSAQIENSGLVSVGVGGTSATYVRILSDGTSLAGTGALVLTDSATNFIVSNNALAYLGNRSTISGAGTIGDANLILQNLVGGVIDADGSVALKIVGATAQGDAAYNSGLIETTGTGGLTISGTLGNAGTIAASGSGALTFKNATVPYGGGLIKTTQAGASIILNAATINGGALSLVAGTTMTVAAGTTSTISSTRVENGGTINVPNGTNGTGTTLTTTGVLINTGLIALKGTTLATAWQIGNFYNVSGHGTIDLASGGKNSIVSNGASAVFKNLDNTIIGAGTIGDANLALRNGVNGIINASRTGGITIDTGANAINNNGLIESTSSAGLIVKSDIDNSGQIFAKVGTIDLMGNVYDRGNATIGGSATVRFEHHTANDVIFDSTAKGTLRLDTSATDPLSGIIRGFTGQDKIDLSDIAYVASGANATTFAYHGGSISGQLTVSQGTATTTLNLRGNYTQASFAIQSDQHGGTLVT